MSNTVDERVVSMKFDNKQFESNVQTSLGTLDKLKQSLKFTDAAKGFENVNVAAGRFDISALSGGIETVKAKFSALQIMATTALANITNSAVNAGKRISSALTIEPVKQGFEEYETQINAVQTILANTSHQGTTLKQVNSALDELNTYADKTIYNFTEMTKNIGTFTAAGVDLDTSVNSIKGIANLAAVSGSTSQQASTAMYQLSQALAAGKVSLQDWNSVVNAGMGGKVFQDALVRTSELLGTGADKAIEKYGSFRESLTKGEWLTTEVLTETLKQFAGSYTKADLIQQGFSESQAEEISKMATTAEDAATKVKTFTQLIDTLKESLQSGWTQSWEIIIGDFEEAKKLWTEVSDYFGDAINKSASARNELLQAWADGGGRTMAIESIKNAFEGLLSIVKPIKEAFGEVFPPMTAEKLLELTKRIRDITTGFKLNNDQSEKLKTAFKGLFSIIGIAVDFVKKFIAGISGLSKNFDGLGNRILNTSSSIGDWLIGLRKSINQSDVFGKAVERVTSFIQNAIDKIKEFASIVGSKFSTPGWDSFLEIMQNVWSILQKIGSKISKVGSEIGKALSNAFRNGDVKTGLDIFNSGILTAILLGIKKFVGSLTDIANNAGGFLDGITGILDGVKGSLEAWQQDIKTKAILKIAIAIGILAASLLAIATIDSEKLTDSLLAVGGLFGELTASMAIFNKFDGSLKGAKALIEMAASILILAIALKQLSNLSWEELEKGLVGIAGLMAITVAAAKIMSSNGKKISKGASQIVIMATALKILASVCKDLAKLSWEELGKGLVGIAGLLAEITIFLKLTKDSKKVMSVAVGMVVMASALKIMASACTDIAELSWEEIAKALVGIGGLLIEIAAFTKLSGGAKHIIATSTALVILATALKIMASAVRDFSSMSWEEIARGLTAMAGALVAVTIAVKLMPKNLIGIGTGLVVVSAALIILSKALNKMGGMTWDKIAKGLVTLGGSMAILAIGLNFMKSTLAGSVAMLVAAGAIDALTPALKALGNMSWESISKGLVAIAGAFAVIGIAGLVLKPLVPTILALSGAMALFGVACVLVGTGAALIAVSISAAATSLSVGATALVAALAVIVTGIVGMIPPIIEAIGETIVLLCKYIIEAAPLVAEAVTAVVLGIMDILVQNIPPIVDGLLKIVVELLKSLVEYTPQIVDHLCDFIIRVINSLSSKIPEIIKACANLISSIFSGIMDVLKDADPDILVQGIAGIGLVTVMMKALSSVATLIPKAMVGVLGVGAVIAEMALVLAAIGGLAQISGLDWLINEGGELLKSIGTAIGKFVGGIVGGVMEGVTSALPQIGTDLSGFMTNLKPFIEGAKSFDASSMDGVKALAETIIILTAAELLDGITSWITGGSSLTSFAEQIVPFGKAIVEFSSIVSGNVDEGAVTAAANAGKILSELASTLPNSGGVVGFFTGENDLDTFAEKIVPFGEAITEFSSVVAGNVDEDAVAAAANAGKMLSELASTLPNSGGVVGFFTGENDLDTFAEKITPFGKAIASFSDTVSGNIDEDAVAAATNAGKMLSELASTLPNSGGVVGFFTGENDIDTFGEKIVPFGKSIVEFSSVVSGKINEDAVQAAANAGEMLCNLTNQIPNSGGVAQWFTGEHSISKFADDIPKLGAALKSFSDKLGTDFSSENVTAATNAATAIADMTNHIPNSGGISQWFTGEHSISKFSDDLPGLGTALKDFSTSLGTDFSSDNVSAATNAATAIADMTEHIPKSDGVVQWFTGETSISSFADDLGKLGAGLKKFGKNLGDDFSESKITAAVNAATAIADMTEHIPKSNGVAQWFTGETSISSFADDLGKLGTGLKKFGKNLGDDFSEAKVTAAVNAATAIADMTKHIPSSGGVAQWFTGEASISTFAGDLPTLGKGLKGFGDSLGDSFSESKVTAAANAAKAIADMTKHIPSSGGVAQWFTGEASISTFADDLPTLGKGMKGFSDSLGKGFKPENVSAATDAAKDIAEMTKTAPENSSNLTTFGESIVNFGNYLSNYFTDIVWIPVESIKRSSDVIKEISGFASKIDPSKLTKSVDAVNKLADTLNKLAKIKEDSTEGFNKSISNLGKVNVTSFIKTFTDAEPKVTKAGESLITALSKGVKNKNSDITSSGKNAVSKFAAGLNDKTATSAAKKAFTVVVSDCLGEITSSDNIDKFSNAGKNLVQGFASGISSNSSLAVAKAQVMAELTLTAVKTVLGIASPSKEFYKVGSFAGKGLVNALSDYRTKTYKAGQNIGDSAKEGLGKAIYRLRNMIDSGIDNQPTIRPVLDLSEISRGADSINGMFDMSPSVGVLSNIDSISSMINENQNGTNDDLISAIKELSRKLDNTTANTYNINGITYDDGSNITEAVKTLVRAARIERRI